MERLNTGMKVIELPDIAKQMFHKDADPVGGSPDQFKTFIKSEHDRWRTIVIESGAVAQ